MDERYDPNKVLAEEVERTRKGFADDLYQNYKALLEAGFNEDQALKITATLVHILFGTGGIR